MVQTLEQLACIDVASLVPQRYAEYRPAVADALVFFVQRLPPERIAAAQRTQAGLPADADAAHRLVSLMHECPTLHKIGQVVARHRALDAGFRRRLQQLESMEPRTPMEQVRPIVQRELGAAALEADLCVADAALAEASVAIVIPFTYGPERPDPLHRPSPAGGRGNFDDDRRTEPRGRGVLKVLRPGVQERLEAELNILAELAGYLDDRRGQYGLPDFGYRETFDEVRTLLTNEVRFDLEQKNLARAAARFADDRRVRVPGLLPWCTPRLTAMQQIDGVKATDAVLPTRARRRALAETIVRALAADVVFSRDEPVVFHADPHAGNLFVTDDDRLAVFDWSLTGRLSQEELVQVAQMIVGAIVQDAGRVARAAGSLAQRLPDESTVREIVEDAIRELRRGRLPGPDWLTALLHRLVAAGGRFSAGMLMFRKSLLTLEGVVADVCEGFSLDRALIALGVRQFAREWPHRGFAPLASRDFATHLSNWDLAELFGDAPAAMTRFWAHEWNDWLARFAAADEA